MKLTKFTLIAIMTLLVLGCGEGKYASISNSELNKKKRHCDSIPKKSAVFANGCDKITQEVKSRRKARSKK
jgi:hypothetical protein